MPHMRRRLYNKRMVSACADLYRGATEPDKNGYYLPAIKHLSARCVQSKSWTHPTNGRILTTLYGRKFTAIVNNLHDWVAKDRRPTRLWR